MVAGWSRVARAGLALVAVGGIAWSAAFAARAFTADASELDRLVGVANVLGMPLTALGAVLVVMEKVTRRVDISSEMLIRVEQDLAAAVLRAEGLQRCRLVGTDIPEAVPANVSYRQSLVRFRTAGGEEVGDLANVAEYYRGLEPGRLVILGAPGSGKTVLALELLVRLLEQRQLGMPGLVPVRASLSGWDTRRSLEDWLADRLVEEHRLSRAVAVELLRRQRVLPVLDGLDEMDSDDGPPGRAAAAVDQLNTLLRASARGPVVLTCRRQRYEQLPRQLLDATCVHVQPLDAQQIHAYLRAQLRDVSEELAWTPVLEALAGDPSLAHVLDTPWRLTLAVAAYRDGLDPSALLGCDSRGQIDALLLPRFIPALTRLHPRSSGRGYDAVKVNEWLARLAGHLRWQARNGLSDTDLILHQLWPKTIKLASVDLCQGAWVRDVDARCDPIGALLERRRGAFAEIAG
jgi:NACHT domain